MLSPKRFSLNKNVNSPHTHRSYSFLIIVLNRKRYFKVQKYIQWGYKKHFSGDIGRYVWVIHNREFQCSNLNQETSVLFEVPQSLLGNADIVWCSTADQWDPRLPIFIIYESCINTFRTTPYSGERPVSKFEHKCVPRLKFEPTIKTEEEFWQYHIAAILFTV
jgi:hypothetical protein